MTEAKPIVSSSTVDKSIVAAEFLQNQDRCTAAAIELAAKKNINANSLTELRNQFGDPLAGLIAESASLQIKAKRKFGDLPGSAAGSNPNVWWATRRSLQQATPWQVANLKASWLGKSTVYDLCCALGGDAMAFATRGPTIAVDRDPILVAMAESNLSTAMKNHTITTAKSSPTKSSPTKPSPTQRPQTRCDDVVDFQIPQSSTVHIDPDRRTDDSNRGTRAETFSPTWPQVIPLISQSDSAIVKLAPATELDWQPSDRPSHRCWIALQGTVREQSLLVGDAVERADTIDNGRSAYRVAADGSWHRHAPANDASQKTEATSRPQAWLIDPVSSIRAAGLTESFASQHSLQTLGGLGGFLTSDTDELPEEVAAMATTGRVVWTGSANDRKLKRELRVHGWFPETVKCRSVDRDPADLFRRYRECGDAPVTLWIGRVGKKVYAAITQ